MNNSKNSDFIPPPPEGLRKKRRILITLASLILAAGLIFYIVVTPYLIPSIAPNLINVDADHDGLANAEEKTIGTDPARADSDNDGLTDGLEVKTYFTDPLIPDTDGDNITDGAEVTGWDIEVDNSQRHVTSNPRSMDSDADLLTDYDEYARFRTDPRNNDTDSDGLCDKWEVDYGFAPANSYDGFQDPDYDGLTNAQEYELGTITRNGALSYEKDLFVEIDYTSGYQPSRQGTDWLASYYGELGINVHITVDQEISSSQLASIGISPETLDPNECVRIEQKYHDNPSTHVYAFYAKALSEPGVLGWASNFGAFLSKETVDSLEGLSVLWLTDRIRAEKTVLLHELGHTLHILTEDSQGQEQYCSNLGCVMSAPNTWYDIIGSISQLVVLHSNYPRYCQEHAAMISLRNKWSVDENWRT
jgi:hypothetical protein